MAESQIREEGDRPSSGSGFVSFLRETLLIVIIALALSVVLKTWFAQAFYIPSESMEDTLQIDDRIMVNKLADDLDDINRGDVVVFVDPGNWLNQSWTAEPNGFEQALTWVGLRPANAGQHLVKRVIGLPGDNVTCCDSQGRIQINGAPIDENYLKPGVSPSEITFDVTVPAGHVWVLGDNRSRSEDSRYHTGSIGAGFVPVANIEGRAFVVMWPLSNLTWLSNPGEVFAEVPDP